MRVYTNTYRTILKVYVHRYYGYLEIMAYTDNGLEYRFFELIGSVNPRGKYMNYTRGVEVVD